MASRQVNLSQVSLKLILSFAVVFNFTLVFILPIASDDVFPIFRKQGCFKISSNPYYVPYGEFKHDILYSKLKQFGLRTSLITDPFLQCLEPHFLLLWGDNLFLNVYLLKSPLFLSIY